MWGYGSEIMGSWGWMLFHGLFWLVVLALLGRAIVLLMRQTARRPPGLDVLEERYARGEINRDEYLEKKRDIRG
jgi:putative membrane protein